MYSHDATCQLLGIISQVSMFSTPLSYDPPTENPSFPKILVNILSTLHFWQTFKAHLFIDHFVFEGRLGSAKSVRHVEMVFL